MNTNGDMIDQSNVLLINGMPNCTAPRPGKTKSKRWLSLENEEGKKRFIGLQPFLSLTLDGIRALDVGIILDQTLALKADEWRDVLTFLKKIVDGLGVSSAHDGTRVGLMRFSSRPYVSLYFNTIKDDILTSSTVNKFIEIIQQIQGDRRLDLALQKAATDMFTNRGGSRYNAKKVESLSFHCYREQALSFYVINIRIFFVLVIIIIHIVIGKSSTVIITVLLFWWLKKTF